MEGVDGGDGNRICCVVLTVMVMVKECGRGRRGRWWLMIEEKVGVR